MAAVHFVARQNYFEFCHESPRTPILYVEMNSTGMKMDKAHRLLHYYSMAQQSNKNIRADLHCKAQ